MSTKSVTATRTAVQQKASLLLATVAAVVGFGALAVTAPGYASARNLRMTVGAANKRATDICSSDQRVLSEQGARLNLERITAGQAAWHYRRAAAATRSIDKTLGKLRVSASYDQKLAAFRRLNSKMIGVDTRIASVLAGEPSSRLVSPSSLERYNKVQGEVANPALLSAAYSDIPTVCVVI
jgi:hypothetical protein